VAAEIQKHYTKGVVLVVTNPVDIITYKMSEWLGLPGGMVFGTGCILDSSRFASILASAFKADRRLINAPVAGEHGTSQVALWSQTTIAGSPVSLSGAQKDEIEKNVISMGTSIIREKGRTHYGVATCVCYIADAILNGRNAAACVSSVLTGQYGLRDIALSLPCVIGRNGISEISEREISRPEHTRLRLSADTVRAVLEHVSK
jgi:L-lactate dehydrogenase